MAASPAATARAATLPSSSTDKREAVRVVVRVRPLSAQEGAAGHASVVEADRSLARVTLLGAAGGNGGGNGGGADPPVGGCDRQFAFDAVFDGACSQRDVYEGTAMSVVNAVLQGYNGTVFAYGQTGTGKTYTMEGEGGGGGSGGDGGNGGDAEGQLSSEQGIIPAAFDHIFGAIQASEGTT
jgi:kinesin family protein 3/17